MTAADLLEREHEVGRLDQVFGGAIEGRGSTVAVRGDAGIGKTALVEAGIATARELGFEVIRARSDALESELSFGVCLQLFEHLADGGGDDGRGSDLLAGAAAFARPVLGDAAAVAAGPGEDRTLPLIHGLYWLCENLAERAPLLVAVDDAHWADVPSLRFLHFLARRIEGLAAAIVIAARPAESGSAADGLLAAIEDQPSTVVLCPVPFGEDAVTLFVESELGSAEPGFARLCRELSGGNPLYLRELLRSVRDAAIAPVEANAGRLEKLGPAGVSGSVLRRVADAGPEARALATIAAVGGGRLSLRDVASLAGVEVPAAQRAADALAEAAVLATGEPLRFAHPLVRTAVYESVPAAELAGAHVRVAELLRERGAAAEAIAAHLLEAELRGGAWVGETLLQAATEAMVRGAPAAASRYLRRALEEEPSGPQRGEVLVALGLAEAETGDPAGAELLTSGIELVPQPERRAGAVLGLALTLGMQGRTEAATAAYERGLDEIAMLEGSVARDLEAVCAIGLAHDLDARPAALERIESLLRDPDIDASASGRMLLAQAASERAYQGGSIEELRALAARAAAPGLNEDDPTAFWTFFFVAFAYDDIDEYGPAEDAVAKALSLARRRGSVVQAAAACHPRAFVNCRSGRIAAALADAQASAEGVDLGWRIALPSSRAVLAETRLERGELELASDAVELPDGDAPWKRLVSYVWLLAARARVQLEHGRPEAALEIALDCGALAARARITNPSVISWRSVAALASSRIGDAERARELAAEETALASGFGAPRAHGAALRVAGLVAGGAGGIESLEAAVAVLEPSEARLEHARTLIELGSALRRTGRRRDARDPLREGLDLAHRCGAVALEERARTELRASGARPRRVQLSGLEALTPSERRIAAMASEGFSNPQIAQALFVSRRTVEMHLTNAYRKLGIESRDELPAALRGQQPT